MLQALSLSHNFYSLNSFANLRIILTFTLSIPAIIFIGYSLPESLDTPKQLPDKFIGPSSAYSPPLTYIHKKLPSDKTPKSLHV